MIYIKIEDFDLIPGEVYLTYPHHRVLQFGSDTTEHFFSDLDYKFWEYDELNSCGAKLASPYPTHVCKLPSKPA